MGADLRALVGIEEALEQRAENRRIDLAPVEAAAACNKPMSPESSGSARRPSNRPPLKCAMIVRSKSPPCSIAANS